MEVTLRALTISSHGGVEQLELRDDLAAPTLSGPQDVRVRVLAAALNHLDLFVLRGLPGPALKAPWILGADATGIVEAVGEAVTKIAPGDRVIINPGLSDGVCEYCLAGDHSLCLRYGILGEHHPGSIAEFLVVPESNVSKVPVELPTEQAAAFTLVTLTAWHMLVARAGLASGNRVLIQGIGGGVALAGLQIAKLLGAEVWVTSSSDDKLARAMQLGADHGINNRKDDVGKTMREQTGKRGVDIVLDNVGAATWKGSLASLGKRGRLVTCGGTSGPVVETDVRRLFWHQQSILGSTMGSNAEFETIAGHLRAGRLLPVVDSVFALEDARDAFARLAAGEQFGKVVLRVSDAI